MVAMAAPAMAQDEATEDADADRRHRLAHPAAGLQRRQPVVTVNEALLENSSTAAIESNLNRLPQFVPAQTPTAGGDIQPTATNTPGAATVSLRGIGANRDLVLVDGRRSTPSNASGVTDISTIPAAAIERIEIIPGGASATYGADAGPGVTHFTLKKHRGVELTAACITEEGDGSSTSSRIMGTDFPDGRGSISPRCRSTPRSELQRDRDWYQRVQQPDRRRHAFFNPGRASSPTATR